MQSFTRKKIDVTIILVNNPEKPERAFFDNGSNVVKLTGMRVEANIRKVGTVGYGTMATIRIYGMKQTEMNKLSLLNFESLQNLLNKIIISAGDDQMGMFDVFGGQIINAWADYSAAPEVALVIQANAAYFFQIAPAESSSYQTNVDAAQVFQDLAKKMNYTFVNNGVRVNINRPYLAGTLMKQATTLAQQVGCMLIIDGDVMTISPIGAPLKGEVPLINASSGLVGYPTWYQGGIAFNTLFNPAIQFGGLVKVDSEITIANGLWYVTALNYTLESEKPNGAWFCHVEAGAQGNAITGI